MPISAEILVTEKLLLAELYMITSPLFAFGGILKSVEPLRVFEPQFMLCTAAGLFPTCTLITAGCDTVTLTLGVTLNAGSQLSVYSNSTSLAISVFGTEIF